jgi:cytochrome c-type biogenesis protein CcmH/NrfF
MMRYRMARWPAMAALVLALLGGVAMAWAAARPTVQEMAEGLTCQCGCGLTVANCNHPTCGFSVPMRTEIAAMIKRGMSREEILQSFRRKYGEKILSAPTTQGFNLLAWVMPYVMVGAGVLLIGFAVSRWHRGEESSGTPPEKAGGGRADDKFDSDLRRKLESDLRRQL